MKYLLDQLYHVYNTKQSYTCHSTEVDTNLPWKKVSDEFDTSDLVYVLSCIDDVDCKVTEHAKSIIRVLRSVEKFVSYDENLLNEDLNVL